MNPIRSIPGFPGDIQRPGTRIPAGPIASSKEPAGRDNFSRPPPVLEAIERKRLEIGLQSYSQPAVRAGVGKRATDAIESYQSHQAYERRHELSRLLGFDEYA